MKKVIIITREGEYPVNSIAYQRYSTEKFEACDGKLHCYIKNFIPSIFDNDDEEYAHEHWDPLTTKGILPSYNEMFLEDKYERLHEESGTTEDFESWLKKKMTKKVEQAIEPSESSGKYKEIDNRPYIQIKYNNFDVYFVFLNRIFDTFVDGSNEYGALVNDDSRLDFIKAICDDCGQAPKDPKGKEAKERAILYIHDKEWYVSGAPYTAMQNGNYTKMAKSPIEQQKELQKYFDTIKVFLHIPSPFFDEIKSLNFNDYDIDLDILERGHY